MITIMMTMIMMIIIISHEPANFNAMRVMEMMNNNFSLSAHITNLLIHF